MSKRGVERVPYENVLPCFQALALLLFATHDVPGLLGPSCLSLVLAGLRLVFQKQKVVFLKWPRVGLDVSRPQEEPDRSSGLIEAAAAISAKTPTKLDNSGGLVVNLELVSDHN